MTPPAYAALMLALSYVLGSIPAGLWLGLALRGVDIREHGSGNIGATNTFRALGAKIGGTAFLFDVTKGLAPVLAARYGPGSAYLPMLCGLAAILGHSFSVFLRFRGGKGVATSTGAFLGLAPCATLVAGLVFGLVFWRSRFVSAASISAAAALALAVFLVPLIPGVTIAAPVQYVAVAVAALVIWKHRSNIRSLRKGDEHRF